MFSQIDARVGFFRSVLPTGTANLVKIANAQATMENENSTSTGSQYGTTTVMRDMGKTVTFVNAAGQAIQRYRSVRIVNNLNAEGVCYAADAETEYVLVWAASGSGVNVVRLG